MFKFKNFPESSMLFLLFLPYFGALGYYNYVVLALTASLIALAVSTRFVSVSIFLVMTFFALVIFLSGLIGLFGGKELNALSFTDLIFLAQWLALGSILMHAFENNQSLRYFVRILFIVAMCNFLIVVLARFNILETAYLYGETSRFDATYTRGRAIGIIGQPGKLALFSAMGALCCALCYSIVMERRARLLLCIAAFAFVGSALFSFSRIGFALSLLPILVFPWRTKIAFFAIAAVVGIFMIDASVIQSLLRIDEAGVMNISSFEYRIVMRQYALHYIGESFITSLIGFGPSKEAADALFLPIAGHTLRHPDSSFTLIIFRYGLIGIVLAVLLNIVTLKIFRLKSFFLLRPMGVVSIGIYIVAVLLDPLWHDSKILMFYLVSLKLLAVASRGNFGKVSAGGVPVP